MSNIYGFLLTFDHADLIDGFNDAQYGALIRACVDYQRNGTPFPETGDKMLRGAFIMFKKVIDRRNAGSKGGQTTAQRHGQQWRENGFPWDVNE